MAKAQSQEHSTLGITAASTAPQRGIPCGYDVFEVHPIPGNPVTEKSGQAYAGASVVGLLPEGTACRFLGSRVIPSKWCAFVPPTSSAREEHPRRYFAIP